MSVKKKNIAINRAFAIGIVLILAVLLAVTLGIWESRERAYRSRMESEYRRAYYDLNASLKEMETKLDKLRITNSAALSREMLEDVRVQAQLSAQNASALSPKEGELEELVRFFNQLGDYCHTVAKRGGEMSDAEREKTEKLYVVLKALLDSFESADAKLSEGQTLFRSLNEGVSLLGENLENFSSDSSVEYPEMIYDGPFSDGLNDRNALFLQDKPEIKEADALTMIRSLFPDDDSLQIVGNADGSLASYLIQGEKLTAQITKTGGYLLSLSLDAPNKEVKHETHEAKALAQEFLTKAGFVNMECVWETVYHNSIYFNFAYSQNGIVCYPDLVKVKVDLDALVVSGLESMNYLYNHRERTLSDPLRLDEARQTLREDLTIDTERIALVPTEWNTEILAYEFIARRNGATYYLYVDASTIETVRVMRVIEDPDAEGGQLLL